MIALPATPPAVLAQVIVPALERLPESMRTPRAQVLLLAIALQESGLAARRQVNGPARGLWQFEVGGVQGVLTHRASAPFAPRATAEVLQASLETDDQLACRVARLLLYTLPTALPPLGQAELGWAQYTAAWRPGKPRAITWARNYRAALETVP